MGQVAFSLCIALLEQGKVRESAVWKVAAELDRQVEAIIVMTDPKDMQSHWRTARCELHAHIGICPVILQGKMSRNGDRLEEYWPHREWENGN